VARIPLLMLMSKELFSHLFFYYEKDCWLKQSFILMLDHHFASLNPLFFFIYNSAALSLLFYFVIRQATFGTVSTSIFALFPSCTCAASA